jgi:hypothetical protein
MTVKLVQGVIEQISIKEIANGPDRFDNTHRRSAKIDGVWYSFGGCKSNKWNVKMGNDFKVLGVGSEVAFKAEQSGDFWNGKSMMVINIVEGDNTPAGKASQSTSGGTQGSYTPKPKDMSGVSVGHSFNGAMNFLTTWGVEPSNENIVEYGKKVHNATEKLKAEYAKANPDMSSYDTGAAVGNSILNACKLVGTEVEFEQGIYDLANDFLANVVPEILKHVKGEIKQAPPTKVTRAPVKKPAATKAKPVEEAQPSANRSGFDDMDDEIPFANPMRLSAGLYLAI